MLFVWKTCLWKWHNWQLLSCKLQRQFQGFLWFNKNTYYVQFWGKKPFIERETYSDLLIIGSLPLSGSRKMHWNMNKHELWPRQWVKSCCRMFGQVTKTEIWNVFLYYALQMDLLFTGRKWFKITMVPF